MTQRILLLDAGNSGVKAASCTMRRLKDGTYKSGKVQLLGRVETKDVDDAWLRNCAAQCPEAGDKNPVPVAFSSVVPRVSEIIRSTFPTGQLWQVTADQDVGWPIDYPDRARLGGDRLCAAAGARSLNETWPLVAIDFGTATTFNVLNEKGAFIGGVIAPGFDMMLGYLHEKTAQLPRLEPVIVHKAIGRDTLESMQAGASFGYRAMIKGILIGICMELVQTIPELADETGEATLSWGGAQAPGRAKKSGISAVSEIAARQWMIPHIPFVATGGYATMLAPNLDLILDIRPNLNLEGLAVMAACAMSHGKLGA